MIRSGRERLLQAVAYETCAFWVAVPLFSFASDSDLAEGAGTVMLLLVAEMLWSPLHNAVFDRVEWHGCGAVASQRPVGRRILHAVSHEVSSMVVTVPILVFIGGQGLLPAIALDVTLSIAFVAYAFAFHLVYDRVRPVGAGLLRD